MISNSILNQITLGREGNNWGYSMGLKKLEGIIDGVTKSTYTLIFSTSGAGKTSLALYSYIYKPLMEHLDDGKFKVIYFSLEMSAEKLLLKLLSIYIFETYHIELSVKELLSVRKDYTLSDENFKIVKECMPWLKKVEDAMVIFDKSLNCKSLYTLLMKELQKNGTFTETDNRKIYTPDDPDAITIVAIDHLSLVRPTEGRSKKEEMDLISSYLVTLRNMCGISPLVIMQSNRDSAGMDRRKAGLNNLRLTDIKDSGSPSEDAEVVLSIFNPFKEKLCTYNNYNIEKLRGKFRAVTVLKSRYGETDVEIGCAFYGASGAWKELPRGDEANDYDSYISSDYYFKDEEVKEEKSSSNFNYTF